MPRTPTISLGIGPVGRKMLRDLRGYLAASDRDAPPPPRANDANCTVILRTDHASYARPVPPHTVQIIGAQVCAFALQVHPGAGTRPPPLHAGHLPSSWSWCSSG
jgi:hypothetical protein